MTKWYLPLAAAIIGIALRIVLQLESPGDDYSGWFSWSGALGGAVIVFTSIAVLAALKYVFKGGVVCCRQPRSRELAHHREPDVDRSGLRT